MASPASTQNTRQTLLDAAMRAVAQDGFRAVGLNEILSLAGVPKGSFYHYFRSKDAFGKALMQDYFTGYLSNMDRILGETGKTAADRVLGYFEDFRERQSADDFQAGCLVVKLGPEVSDFSESMRGEMRVGVSQILDRLERVIGEGVADETITSPDPRASAEILYDMWLGASIIAKISRDQAAFDTTITATRQHLGIDETRH